MAGFPVTLSDNGTPFVSVTSGGAPATISPNGKPIKLVADNAPPLVISGLNPPVDFNWQPIDVIAGTDGTQWVGYSDGGETRPQPAFGSISGQPSDKTELLAIYDDTNSDVYLVVFSGDWLSEMNNLTLSIGGFPITPFEAQLVSGNTWLRYNGVGDWVDEDVYQIEFG